ncbi:hypothetical protein GH714_041627 [Hevea brasiliensis]|uniref:Lon proteolytic domain-containing protein n=1 Tax=Hevea brasiliensis TaxID=3981 RepID=A0A6A6MVG1_HEVBR|nr:hypothetical protein GH714_041627 [Hevea brasiliensis]
MTGEMILRGLVLLVGGIKDKCMPELMALTVVLVIMWPVTIVILAAHRYRIRRVILPERNLKDLVEVPSAVLGNLEILLANKMEDVLEQAFEGGCQWRQHSKLR